MSIKAMTWAFGSDPELKASMEAESAALQLMQDSIAGIVETADITARLGDGNCGFIFIELERALVASGHLKRPEMVYGPKIYTRPSHSISASKALKVFSLDKYACVKCGAQEDLTVDHIIPLRRGGTNEIHNLQTLCRQCNSRKKDTLK